MNTNTLFRFPLGEVVRWGDDRATYLLVQRRYTERDILGPVVEYLLGACDHPEAPLAWAYEADLLPGEETHA